MHGLSAGDGAIRIADARWEFLRFDVEVLPFVDRSSGEVPRAQPARSRAYKVNVSRGRGSRGESLAAAHRSRRIGADTLARDAVPTTPDLRQATEDQDCQRPTEDRLRDVDPEPNVRAAFPDQSP